MKNSRQDQISQPPFIPAEESRWFIFLFDIYCRWLFHRRFDEVQITSDYQPDKNQKTIYFLNHHSWWDGLIPFLLNQRLFRQRARGMMEDKQLRQYPFFRRLGVFSINLSTPKASVISMRYAVTSMQRDQAALYIYPQGKIVPFTTRNLSFKKGVGWLAKKVPGADLVPVGIHIHTMDSDKPKLRIHVGAPSDIKRQDSSAQINSALEKDLSNLLCSLVE